jgi:hypothetical protein
MTDPVSAATLYQRHLDAVGETIAARDFAGYCALYAFPNTMITRHTTLHFATEADLAQLFRSMCHSLQSSSVAAPARICMSAEFSNENRTIQGTHRTWLVNHADEIQQSYTARATLHLGDDGIWRLTESQYDEDGPILPNQIVALTTINHPNPGNP